VKFASVKELDGGIKEPRYRKQRTVRTSG